MPWTKRLMNRPINKCNQPTNSGVSLVVSLYVVLSINVAQDHIYDIYTAPRERRVYFLKEMLEAGKVYHIYIYLIYFA